MSTRFHKFVFQQLGNDDAGTVITQTSGVDVGGCEVVSQREHRQEGGISGFVPEVVTEFASRQFGARSRFGGYEAGGFPLQDVVPHERECDASEVGASPEAGNYHIGIFSCHFHLFFCFQSDNGLVQGYVA